MPRRNQDTITFLDFDGVHSYPRLYNSDGDVDGTGPEGLEECFDMMHTPHGHLVSRPGIVNSLQIDTGATARGLKRMFNYPREQGRFIVITYSGRVFDTGWNPAVPILIAAAGSDLYVQSIGKRIFLSVTPVSGTAGIYIWDPDTMSQARAAAGLKPTGTFTVAVSGTNGNTEPGQHVYAIAFETDTGFITKPNLYVSLTSPLATKKAVDLNPIPIGPAGTVARWILASKVLRNWDGNLQSPELFFALRIGDNTTTSMTGASGLSKYDTEYLVSADYLKDIRETLPRANALCLYGGRLVLVGGDNSDDPVRLSQPGDYETFLNTEGYLKALPLDGGTARVGVELYGALYLYKDSRTFATQDSGASPARWPVANIDTGRGCSTLGIARTPGGSTDMEGGTCVLTREGLHFFNGRYSALPLTHKIGGLFLDLIASTVNDTTFRNWNSVIDTHRKIIYIYVGLASEGPAEPSNYARIQVLVGDYSRGLDWSKIRWSFFRHYNHLQCMAIDQDSRLLPRIRFGQGGNANVNGYIFSINSPETSLMSLQFADTDGFFTYRSVPWRVLTGSVGLSKDGGQSGLEGIGVRIAALENPAIIQARIYNADTGEWTEYKALEIPPRTDDFLLTATTIIKQFDVTAERIKIELSGTSDIPVETVKGVRLIAIHAYEHLEDIERPM